MIGMTFVLRVTRSCGEFGNETVLVVVDSFFLIIYIYIYKREKVHPNRVRKMEKINTGY